MNGNTANNIPKIFGIGSRGLIGSRVTELLSDKYSWTNLSISEGIDITNPDTLSVLHEDKDYGVVIHFAAKADVDGCERDKDLGKNGEAWKVNVTGVENVLSALKGTGKKILYISTDFVFSGNDTPADGYTEDSIPNPVNWYGTTKLEGEKAVQDSEIPYCILRIAYPYRNPFSDKLDFVNAILKRLRNGEPVRGVTDHIMTPTFIDDIAATIHLLLSTNANGIFHVVGSTYITPYDAIKEIADTFHIGEATIEKTTREDFFRGKAHRPFNLSLKNAKIERLGVKMHSFENGLLELAGNISRE